MELIAVPTLNVPFLKPRRMGFTVRGGAQEGPRNGLGQSFAFDLAGSGMVVGSYENCGVMYPEEHEYSLWADAYGGTATRAFNVPIYTDFMGPFPLMLGRPNPFIGGIPFSDGSLFSDGSGFSQATVTGVITEDADFYAGRIKLRVTGASRPLRHSDWFSIFHPTRGFRAYRYWKVWSKTEETNPVYELSIQPALREATPAGADVDFARPRCVMRMMVDSDGHQWGAENLHIASPSFRFIEAD